MSRNSLRTSSKMSFTSWNGSKLQVYKLQKLFHKLEWFGTGVDKLETLFFEMERVGIQCAQEGEAVE